MCNIQHLGVLGQLVNVPVPSHIVQAVLCRGQNGVCSRLQGKQLLECGLTRDIVMTAHAAALACSRYAAGAQLQSSAMALAARRCRTSHVRCVPSMAADERDTQMVIHLKCSTHLSPFQIGERAVEALIHDVPFHRGDDQRLDAAVVAHRWLSARCTASRA
jgi:hypothetical protein